MQDAMASLGLRTSLQRLTLKNRRFACYLAASIGALAVDAASFLALLETGMAAALASVLSYALGIVFHWLLSSRAVFVGRVADGGRARTRQKALFVMTALAGMAITAAIVGSAGPVGADPRLAKLVAIIVSFLATYWLRNRLVFAEAPR